MFGFINIYTHLALTLIISDQNLNALNLRFPPRFCIRKLRCMKSIFITEDMFILFIILLVLWNCVFVMGKIGFRQVTNISLVYSFISTTLVCDVLRLTSIAIIPIYFENLFTYKSTNYRNQISVGPVILRNRCLKFNFY